MDKMTLHVAVFLIGLLCAKGYARVDDAGSRDVPSYRLYEQLMRRYSPAVRPVIDPESQVKVTFGVSLLEVLDLDQQSGRIAVRAWLKMSWTDELLQWNPKQYAGIEHVYIPAKDVWRPDIELYTAVKAEVRDDMNVVVYSNGNVIYITMATFHLTCEQEVNSWTCPFKFGSWVYDGLKVDLQPFDGQQDMDLTEFVPNPRWSIHEATGKRVVKKYDCCPEPYVSMVYKLTLQSEAAPMRKEE